MESIHEPPMSPVETTPPTKACSRLVHLLKTYPLESIVSIQVHGSAAHAMVLCGSVVSAHYCGDVGVVLLPAL